MANVKLAYCGKLVGHGGWVTSISTPQDCSDRIMISGSRDKKVMVWMLNDTIEPLGGYGDTSSAPGYAHRALTGHGETVQDVVASQDGHFALSGSWDKTIRLWDLHTGQTLRRFVKHTSDVNSVAFSADNRQIVSGSRDKTIRLWNTMAECKYTLETDQHTDWVSCVRFSPVGNNNSNNPMIVSCGWDKIVKVWNLPDCKLRTNLVGHTSPLYTVTISPDGSLCASGGKDGVAMLWDVADGKHLYSLESGPPIHAMCFSPCNYWLCAATGNSIKIYDLENKNVLSELQPPKVSEEVKPVSRRNEGIERTWCVSLAWNAEGNLLFAGATDGNIYVYKVQAPVESLQQGE